MMKILKGRGSVVFGTVLAVACVCALLIAMFSRRRQKRYSERIVEPFEERRRGVSEMRRRGDISERPMKRPAKNTKKKKNRRTFLRGDDVTEMSEEWRWSKRFEVVDLDEQIEDMRWQKPYLDDANINALDLGPRMVVGAEPAKIKGRNEDMGPEEESTEDTEGPRGMGAEEESTEDQTRFEDTEGPRGMGAEETEGDESDASDSDTSDASDSDTSDASDSDASDEGASDTSDEDE